MRPTAAQTTTYVPTNDGAASAPPTRTCRITAGVAPGNIIAGIMASHTAANEPNEPSSVATPMFMPVIRQMAMTQHAAATVSTAATTVMLAPLPRELAVLFPTVGGE